MKPYIWGELSFKAEKAVLARRRQVATENKMKRDIENKKQIEENRHNIEKKALRRQMALEEEERTRLEELKAKEKAAAEVDFSYLVFFRMFQQNFGTYRSY